MKTIICLLLASIVQASSCPKGCEFHSGVCACDSQPEIAPSVKPSDEKPPRSGLPAYQAEGIKADMPTSLASEDAKMDQERIDADRAGKRAAGL